jgi:predicted transcriptional regulator/DNA-binding HxlR family transcriptional regulator
MSKLVILGLNQQSDRPQENRDLTTILKILDAECRNCSPPSPLQCIDRCKAYKLKNELRTLRQALENPNYTKELFNVLKNETRLQILQALANGRYQVGQLQQELKKSGQSQSQSTISEEYLHPLTAVGLAAQAGEEYYATTFGLRLIPLLARFRELARRLPTHSECYEETLLQSLLSGPKTFEDIETLILQKNVARVLKRLCSTKLVDTPKERDYVFFFRSKRDPNKETFTNNERKIYDSLYENGSSVGSIAKETGLSARIIYRYLRGMKGKKLVFARRTPKTYRLTCVGEKLASAMQDTQRIIEDTWSSCEIVARNTNSPSLSMRV